MTFLKWYSLCLLCVVLLLNFIRAGKKENDDRKATLVAVALTVPVVIYLLKQVGAF